MNTSIFPDRIKISVVKPLYKKGEKSFMNNYRPVSLLTTFSKVLEKVTYNRLNHYMDTNNISVPE
jgi:Notch-like protein